VPKGRKAEKYRTMVIFRPEEKEKVHEGPKIIVSYQYRNNIIMIIITRNLERPAQPSTATRRTALSPRQG